jgi:hypothetical protein
MPEKHSFSETHHQDCRIWQQEVKSHNKKDISQPVIVPEPQKSSFNTLLKQLLNLQAAFVNITQWQ